MTKTRNPQDEIYGPLIIPSYCWLFIDTREFQRLRHIFQLGLSSLHFMCATHSRFEHSLGVCHLAETYMQNLEKNQPELKITKEQHMAVVLAGLLHDIGHGPWSHSFENVVQNINPDWSHEQNSVKLIKHLYKKYNIDEHIENDVIEACCSYISGSEYKKYPKWLKYIIANEDNDIDLDKLDYLYRDTNRINQKYAFEYVSLIYNSRVIDDQICYCISELRTIERLFNERLHMHLDVYQSSVKTAAELMLQDALLMASKYIDINSMIEDPDEFCRYDCRMSFLIENGDFGEEAKEIMLRIRSRDLYKCIGELRYKPTSLKHLEYSQKPHAALKDEICRLGKFDPNKIRISDHKYTLGKDENKHPLLKVFFYSSDDLNRKYKLSKDELTTIVPAVFVERTTKVFVTDKSYYPTVKEWFEKWKESL